MTKPAGVLSLPDGCRHSVPCQVDLVLWGHVHNALVTCPGRLLAPAARRLPFAVAFLRQLFSARALPAAGFPYHVTHTHPLPSATVYNGTCVKPTVAGGYDAPIHAVIGNGGQSLDGVPAQRAAWDVYHASEFGYSTITAYNATTLEVRPVGKLL